MSRYSGICDWRFAIAAAIAALLSGCILRPQHPAATQPATAVDPATTQPGFWVDQPAAASVTSDDFETLFAACEDVSRDFLFRLDRIDYRSGVLTTRPLVSGQWLEPWRRDARTIADRNESSIATIRRTIRFEFDSQPDGQWRVAPKVLVERLSLAEKRITSVVLYRGVFTSLTSTRLRPRGTRESDIGIDLPQKYWYPIGRDAEFEQALARAITRKLTRIFHQQRIWVGGGSSAVRDDRQG